MPGRPAPSYWPHHDHGWYSGRDGEVHWGHGLADDEVKPKPKPKRTNWKKRAEALDIALTAACKLVIDAKIEQHPNLSGPDDVSLLVTTLRESLLQQIAAIEAAKEAVGDE